MWSNERSIPSRWRSETSLVVAFVIITSWRACGTAASDPVRPLRSRRAKGTTNAPLLRRRPPEIRAAAVWQPFAASRHPKSGRSWHEAITGIRRPYPGAHPWEDSQRSRPVRQYRVPPAYDAVEVGQNGLDHDFSARMSFYLSFRPGRFGRTEIRFSQRGGRQAVESVVGEQPDQVAVVFDVNAVGQIA